MANNPIDTDTIQFWLEFEGLGFTGLYRIAEPIGADALTQNIDQRAKAYGRDVKHGGLDKLTFVDAVRGDTGIEQIINPSGQVSSYLDYGLAWLLFGIKKYGFEFKAHLHISKNGVFAPKMALDFTDKDLTDGYTFVKCKLIDKNAVMNIKRRFDDKFNAFSDKDVNQVAITPAATFNLLRKATPLNQKSQWKSNPDQVQAVAISSPDHGGPGGIGAGVNQINFGANNANEIVPNDSEIQNTLSFAFPLYATPYPLTATDGHTYFVPNGSNSFTYIQARNDLSNVVINISNVVASSKVRILNFMGTNVVSGTGRARLLLLVGGIDLTAEPFDAYTLWTRTIPMSGTTAVALPTSFTLNIPIIPRSKRIYIYFECRNTGVAFNNYTEPLATFETSVLLTSMDVEITGTSTAIDTVIKAVRWYDFIKQAVKFNSTIPVVAGLFQSGGAHYDNAVFCRRMISQKIDSFTSTPKECFESLEEVNCDYELDENEIFIGHQTDFYKNVEIGVFTIIPSEASTYSYNDRTMINKFRYGYKKYEQDRLTKGSSLSIHTESEWSVLNENVENVKEIKNSFTRDPIAQQVISDLEIREPTTSVTEDDDVYIVDIVPLAPNATGGFSNYLNMRIVDGRLQVLNRDSEGETNDVTINWQVIGVGVGGTINITSGENIGSYTIYAATPSVITLTPVSFTPTFEGNAFVSFQFFYTNVNLVTRTSEGFGLNPNGFGNAAYSIKRNMLNYFGELLANVLMYCRKDLSNGYFKSNGAFTSKLTIESANVIENAPVLLANLPNPLMTGVIYNLTLIAGFNEVQTINTAYKMNRGFIRCVDLENARVLKLFPQKLKHKYSSNELTIVGEEKYSNPFVEITLVAGKIFVDDVDYQLNGNLDWYNISGVGMFRAFDNAGLLICNPTLFSEVKVGGVFYSTPSGLIDALQNLI